MTIQRLKQCHDYLRRAESCSFRLDRINSILKTMSKVENLEDTEAIEILTRQRDYVRRDLDFCIRQANEILIFIASVKDSRIKLILTMRFLDSCSWQEIADALGGGNTEASARMALNRFLKTV